MARNPAVESRRLGNVNEACEIVGVKPATVRRWLREGLISAVRVGGGPFMYDLDSVAAMIVEYPHADVDEKIRELVDGAPEFTTHQINHIRLLLHSAASGGDGDGP